jgi:O-antigen/teichoic acid export membrane protein
MDRLRKVIGNTVISLLGQGVTWTSTLILTIAYGRFLGDIKFGELYFAITFVALIGFPIEFGFNQQLTRDVAQEPSRALRYLSNILCIKILLWLLLYGCILVACRLLGYPVEVQILVAICGLTLLSGSIANTFSSLHYAFERVTFPVIGTIFEKGLGALIGILALRYGAGVQIMAWVLLGGSLSNVLWQTVWAMRLVGIPRGFDPGLIRDLVRKSIPFLVYGVLGVIYYRIDTVFLSLVASDAVVGWYGAGYRVFDTLVFLPSLVIGAIMYPIFSKLSLHSEKDLKIAAEKSMNFLLFFGIPIAVGLIVAAPNIIGFLYHRAEFVHAIPVMQLLAPGLVFLYVNSVFSSIIISTRHEKNITIMAGIALVFNVGLNSVAIPMYEHIGAAAVTSLTEFLLMCLAFAFVPRALWPTGSAKVGVKAITAGLVMALVIWTIRQMNLFVILPVAMVTYFMAAALLGTIPREDLKALYTSIRNKAGHAVTDAPAEENADVLIEEALSFTDVDLQPELDSAFAFRLELTDPVMPAYGHTSHSSEIYFPRKAIKDEETAPDKEVGMSVYEDTLPRSKALHLQTDPLKNRVPSNAQGDDTVRLRRPHLKSGSSGAYAPSNAQGDNTVRLKRPLRLRKEFKHMVFEEQEEVKE